MAKSYRKKYVLKTKRDLEILNLCKNLEKFKLSHEERRIVKLIKSQLELDWRNTLLKELRILTKTKASWKGALKNIKSTSVRLQHKIKEKW